jgi:predicted aminopeptidase
VQTASSRRPGPGALALFLLLAATGGCTEVRYLTQAAAGQWQLSRQAVDIDRWLAGDRLAPRTRKLLTRVPSIKMFGERNGLARTKNYTRYVELGRPAVVWVVSACDPLSFRSRVWRFPIIGSITYLGYFHRDAADAYGARLASAGWDVDVRSSRAYSTLGWFRDPVVSTMIAPGDDALGELANVILHESLHATYYVKGQSTLNESVASFVGDHLALDYLDQTVGPDSAEKRRYLEERRFGDERRAALRQAYLKLEGLYASPAAPETKRAAKDRIIAELRRESKLTRPINNATLVQYRTYGSGKDELEALFNACQRSWPRFLRTLRKWRGQLQAAAPQSDAGALLAPLLPRGCEA